MLSRLLTAAAIIGWISSATAFAQGADAGLYDKKDIQVSSTKIEPGVWETPSQDLDKAKEQKFTRNSSESVGGGGA